MEDKTIGLTQAEQQNEKKNLQNKDTFPWTFEETANGIAFILLGLQKKKREREGARKII